INLEDIAAPRAFYVEETLREAMNIPVFHDDQHGTAIITSAALQNALMLQGKQIEHIKIVFAGAGAAGIAIARLYVSLGVRLEHITLTDIHGVIYSGRAEGMNPYLEEFARDTEMRTLAQALEGADAFVGVSAGGIVSQEMVRSMAPRPIIFALANPEPEITYDAVRAVRPDAIIATGRSDYPNQVNNVLCFPFLFRGALDVGARQITEQMKLAAVEALAKLAREEVPEVVQMAYEGERLKFGPDYIIPKPFDPRALLRVAPAVAQAACDEGNARRPIQNWQGYRERLERMQSVSKGFVRELMAKARTTKSPRIAFPEGEEDKILQTAQVLLDEKIATPVLMGDPVKIHRRATELDLLLHNAEYFDYFADPEHDDMVERYYELRSRKGVTRTESATEMRRAEAYAMMMAHTGRVDGVVSGVTKAYRESLEPALRIVGVREDVGCAAGIYIVVTKQGGIKFLADTTVNIDPDAQSLVDIATATVNLARSFDIEPSVAFLSYSNFGTSRHPSATKVARAVREMKQRHPGLSVDGEMQVDVALDESLRAERFDFSTLSDEPNVLIFPNLDSGNIAYKLLHRLGQADVIGPVLVGMRGAVNVASLESSVSQLVNLTVITALQAKRAHTL
ncbi:MAG: phosphate acyltransferase, partial [Myxococcota bacterium]